MHLFFFHFTANTEQSFNESQPTLNQHIFVFHPPHPQKTFFHFPTLKIKHAIIGQFLELTTFFKQE